jgi:hypothetical protein
MFNVDRLRTSKAQIKYKVNFKENIFYVHRMMS